MFDKLRNMFKKEEVKPQPSKEPEAPKVKKPRKPKEKKVVPELTAKEKATAAGEPYINIVRMVVDPNDINSGVFELDFNDKFVLNLIKSGYKIREDDTDSDIVDRWFQTVCRNVALELYEQQQADPENRSEMRVVRSKDLGDGRSEIS